MTRYCLKSGLTKTRIYEMVCEYNPYGFTLPSLRNCTFQHRRDSYWLRFDLSGSRWEVYFTIWAGEARIFVSEQIESDSGSMIRISRKYASVPFDYLRDNDFLRKAA